MGLVTIETKDVEEMSHEELAQKLLEAVNTPPLSADLVVQVFDSRVIYALGDQLFSVPYTLGNGTVTITGIPIPVDRDVSFSPQTNQKGDAMKELLLGKLSDAGITANADISDDDLLSKYNALQANQNSSDDDDASDNTADLAAVVANALKPLTEKLDGLEAQINSNETAEAARLAELVGNSDKYPGLDVKVAKELSLDALKSLAAACEQSHGIPLTLVSNRTNDDDKSFEMPN